MHAYFASDGSYGTAEDIVICNTHDWTEEDWQAVESASDDERHLVAEEILAAKRSVNPAAGSRNVHEYSTYVSTPVTVTSETPIDLSDRDQWLSLTYLMAQRVAEKSAGEIQSESRFDDIRHHEED